MKKSSKRITSLILALLLAVSLVSGALAFTKNTGVRATVQAELPLGVFLNNDLGNVSLVASSYYYDRNLGRYVQSYALSDASKLALLLDQCMPLYRMQAEVDWLKANNNIGSLNKLMNGQQTTIWNSLSANTQYRINSGKMNAMEALNYIKVSTAEYKSNSTLQYYVDYYLKYYLNGDELREMLKIADPQSGRNYDEYNVASLIYYGETVLSYQRTRNLLAAMRPFYNVSTKPYDLEKSYTAQQLANYYANLANAASYFYGSYVTMLNNYRFTVAQ